MSKRILVVEDEEDNRRILRDLLTGAGYEMIEAENGEEALAAVARQRPDLILMDIQLPILDGYEATRRIKADPILKDVPIIALTSYALNSDEDKARAAGCDDFVPKPYSPRQLLCRFSAAGNDDLTSRSDDRRLKSAKARNPSGGSARAMPQGSGAAKRLWRFRPVGGAGEVRAHRVERYFCAIGRLSRSMQVRAR
jgi:two-component system, cell cycle response regulator DivK